jgi:hypothetical protein
VSQLKDDLNQKKKRKNQKQAAKAGAKLKVPTDMGPNPNENGGALNQKGATDAKQGKSGVEAKDLKKHTIAPKLQNKKKAKMLGQIDAYGQQHQGASLIEGYNFFQDLNYGDMVMVFKNPYYDFQYKERQDIEMYQFNHLKELRNSTMARMNLSAKETKKMEANNQKQIQKIKDKFKALVEKESKLNIRIDLQEAYDFYAKYINLKPENQIESRKDEHHQKKAFANALIFFSDRYYVNDMARIKVGKQPYSDCATQSMRDFLLDGMFEFNIFHKIAKRSWYHKKNDENSSVIGGTQDENPLGYFIEHKPKPKPSLLERALSKNQKNEAFEQVLVEETNYFFVKRPEISAEDQVKFDKGEDKKDVKDPKEAIALQYKNYLNMTVALNDASLAYYKDYINKKEIAKAADAQDSVFVSRQTAVKNRIGDDIVVCCKLGFTQVTMACLTWRSTLTSSTK